MKSILFPAISVLLATLFIALMPTEAEGAVYEDTLRLHILASSDSEEDQALKLYVRDAILTKFSSELGKSDSISAAKEETALLLSEIEKLAAEKIRECGYDYEVRASLGVEWYDTRNYEDFVLPCGYYTSLRVVIGEGKGKNWWCVMYPPLCLDIATETAPKDDAIKKYSDEEFRLITNDGYNVKFKILEVVSTAFR